MQPKGPSSGEEEEEEQEPPQSFLLCPMGVLGHGGFVFVPGVLFLHLRTLFLLPGLVLAFKSSSISESQGQVGAD